VQRLPAGGEFCEKRRTGPEEIKTSFGSYQNAKDFGLGFESQGRFDYN
jgi:hypothetical protein